MPDILATETDPLFAWQYDGAGSCPAGCRRARAEGGRICVPGTEGDEDLAGEVAEEVAKGAAKGMVGIWSALFSLFKVAAPIGDEL